MLGNVRTLLGHIPKERRQLSTWQHVEKTLQECAAGDDPVNISVALQIVLRGERLSSFDFNDFCFHHAALRAPKHPFFVVRIIGGSNLSDFHCEAAPFARWKHDISAHFADDLVKHFGQIFCAGLLIVPGFFFLLFAGFSHRTPLALLADCLNYISDHWQESSARRSTPSRSVFHLKLGPVRLPPRRQRTGGMVLTATSPPRFGRCQRFLTLVKK